MIAYLADGNKNYPKEKILISGYKTNIEFDNFRSVTSYKSGKPNKKKFLMIDKGQKEEMSILAAAIITGVMPVPIDVLLLNSYTTIKAIESLRTRKALTIKLSNIK